RRPATPPGLPAKNRNKRSIVLDLKQAEHFAALEKLLQTAGIFIYNLRPKALARVGPTPERFPELNPGIIRVRLVGYGEGGPYTGPPGLRGPDPGADRDPVPAHPDRLGSAAVCPCLVQRPGRRRLRRRDDDDRAEPPQPHRCGPAHRSLGPGSGALLRSSATEPPRLPRPGPAPRRRVVDGCAALAGLRFGGTLGTVILSESFGSLKAPGGLLTAVGRLSGFTGAYLMLIMVVLVARLPWLETSAGQDRLIGWH